MRKFTITIGNAIAIVYTLIYLLLLNISYTTTIVKFSQKIAIYVIGKLM